MSTPRRTFKRPLSESSQNDEPPEIQPPAARRRSNVYDAVAGRVTQWGLTPSTGPLPSAPNPLRPDEVLFKNRKAPTRYEETDYYFAHANLSENQRLPSSDLLKALHAYFSQYYARSEAVVSQKVWKSMDETALIALGILVEETAREVLGETGDLAFTEAAEDSEVEKDRGKVFGQKTRRGKGKEKQRVKVHDEFEVEAQDEDGDDDDDDDDAKPSYIYDASQFASDGSE